MTCLIAAASQTQIYRLAGVEPDAVVQALEETGHLSPTVHFKVDKKNKVIIANASPADQATIRALVDKLSGSDRSFEVIRLRRLRADSVAASIEFMMGVDSKKKKTDNHRYWGWNPWDDEDSSSGNEKTNDFHVHADVEHNRLLLWANKIELRDVQDLLVKLGEIPPTNSGEKTKRIVIDGGNAQETKELLERIRAEWPLVAPNSKLLHASPGFGQGQSRNAAAGVESRSGVAHAAREDHCRAAGGNDRAIDGICAARRPR